MRKTVFSLLLLAGSVATWAHDGYNAFSVRLGLLVPETNHVVLSFERPLSLDNSYSYFAELGAKYIDTRHPQDYYWDGGMSYHHNIVRIKNAELKLTSEAHAGAATKKFFFGVGIGFEYSYMFRNGVELVIHQTNQVNFLHNDTFKNGLLVGLKFPI